MLDDESREKLLAKLKAETAWARRCTPEQARARLIELGHLDAEGCSVYTDGETDAE